MRPLLLVMRMVSTGHEACAVPELDPKYTESVFRLISSPAAARGHSVHLL